MRLRPSGRLAVLVKLRDGDLPDRAAFDAGLAEMDSFLAKAPPNEYLLLETGETFEMEADQLGDCAKALVTKIDALAARAERAVAAPRARGSTSYAPTGPRRLASASRVRAGISASATPRNESRSGAAKAHHLSGASRHPEPEHE